MARRRPLTDIDLSRENVERVAKQWQHDHCTGPLSMVDSICFGDVEHCGACKIAAMLRALMEKREETAAMARLANEHDANERAEALARIHDVEQERDSLLANLSRVGIMPPEGEDEPWIVTTHDAVPCELGDTLEDAIRQTAMILTSEERDALRQRLERAEAAAGYWRREACD